MGITKDPRVGSPIVADENGNIFKQVNGDARIQKGYDSVKYFGERNAGDLNAFCAKNNVKGAYLHYHTDESIKSFIAEEEQKNPENPATPDDGEENGESGSQGNTEPKAHTVI